MAGISNIQNLGSLVKLGIIAIIQEVGKDEFDLSDLAAPFKSSEFNALIKPVFQNRKELIHEFADLKGKEWIQIAKGVITGGEDIYTEIKVASSKLKEPKEA